MSYVHNAAAPGLGKIGVLVALESSADAAVLQSLGKQIAMHIAAANPLALDADGLDPALLERETRDRDGEGQPKAASRPTSSRRWSKARWPSSARNMR